MFWENEKDYLVARLSTTRYLGREDVAKQFLNLLFRHGGIYVPDKWDTEERTRRIFDPAELQQVVTEWTSSEDIRYLFFYRSRPTEIQMCIRLARFAHAKFNDFSLRIRNNYFEDANALEEFLTFVVELCSTFSVDYGLIAQSVQERLQSPVLTPTERLPGVYWANFFGRPYIDFFGREKLLATPCCEVREISDNLILLLTADSPFRPEMLESNEVVNGIKKFLNQNAFPGPNFPDEECAVPEFDFRDVRWGPEATDQKSPEEKLLQARLELEGKGYDLIGESPRTLMFRGADGSVALLDVKTRELSLDVTGTSLSESDPSDSKPAQ